MFSPCPKSQYTHVGKGKCFSCPSGYVEQAFEDLYSGRKCVKVESAKYARATKTGDQNCGSGTFKDPRNGGECWKCPTGYIRPTVSFNPVNGTKAL